MKYVALILVLYAFLKCFCYGLFEVKEKQNKPEGIAVLILAILGLILPCVVIFIAY